MKKNNQKDIFGFFDISKNFLHSTAKKFQIIGRKEYERIDNNSYWSSHENYKADWDGRAALAARLLNPEEVRISEIGCGARFGLKKFLPERSEYFPCDVHLWTPDVSYCDLNKGIVPTDILENSDVTFMLGVLEYIHNIREAISNLRVHCKTLILSYCSTDLEKRRWDKWVNGFTGEQFRNLLTSAGYRVDWQVVYVPGQYVFRVVRE